MGIIINGNSLEVLKTLPDKSVQACVTSPPYWGLRDYGHDGQLGLEKTPQEYVYNMVLLFREVYRVLKDDGTLWLNLGDSYYNYRPGKGQELSKQSVSKTKQDLPTICARRGTKIDGLKEKDLVGIPWRVAMALQDDRWYLRQDIIWHKPNPMPESVKDRCTKAHEYIFLLTKSQNYFFDHAAIKQPAKRPNTGKSWDQRKENGAPIRHDLASAASFGDGSFKTGDLVNRRSVWTVATKPFKEAHFATYPPELIEPCILAGSRHGDIILDPFFGSGTTGLVAQNHGRDFIGIELNPEYIKIAEKRLNETQPQLKLGGL